MLSVGLALGAARCTPTRPPPPTVGTVGVANHDNTGVSLASDGQRAVMAWAATADGRTNIYAAVSENGGATFGAPVRVNDLDGDARVSGEQPPRVALGREVVVVWASRHDEASRIRMARSVDGGRTFLPAVTLHQEPLAGARGWQSVAIGPDDAVQAVWLDGRYADPHAMTHHHGETASGEKPPAPRQDVVLATWTKGAAAAETDIAPNVCFCCKTAITYGPDGALYAAWRHIYPNSMRDIAVARSADNGRTFGPPTRVSEDNWQLDGCPDDGPAMVVDGRNVIHIVWPTLVPGATTAKGIFYAFSTDGGRTFSSRVRIDDPKTAGASHPAIALSGSEVVVAWDDLVSKVRRVEARRISSTGSGQSWSPVLAAPVVVSDGPASYPVLAAGGGVIVAWTAEGAAHAEIRVQRLRSNF